MRSKEQQTLRSVEETDSGWHDLQRGRIDVQQVQTPHGTTVMSLFESQIVSGLSL